MNSKECIGFCTKCNLVRTFEEYEGIFNKRFMCKTCKEVYSAPKFTKIEFKI